MNSIILNSLYLAFIVCTFIIRYPYEKRTKTNVINTNNKNLTEKITLFLVMLGMMLLPLVHIFTSLFSFADYNLPLFAQMIGLVLIIPALWLFYRSHKDLGENWSVTLEIREDHKIVDTGVYKYVRHPMYSAIWLWAFIQALLLHNYIAGLAGLVSFSILYFLRVHKEEKMMLNEFGDLYRDYKKRTKRIIPFII